MEWQIIVALVIVIPVILFPMAFIWLLNVGGIYHAFQAARKRTKAVREKTVEVVPEIEPTSIR